MEFRVRESVVCFNPKLREVTSTGRGRGGGRTGRTREVGCEDIRDIRDVGYPSPILQGLGPLVSLVEGPPVPTSGRSARRRDPIGGPCMGDGIAGTE